MILIIGLANSCKKDESKMVGNATIDFYLTDAPGDYNQILLDVKGMEIHSDANGWETISPFNAGIYDLLKLSNGLDTFLCKVSLPPGKISQIRLILGDNNKLDVNGTLHELKVPSGSQSGLKLNLHKTLIANTSYTIWLDFDACKSIVDKGNGDYNLKPVIRAYSDSTNAKLKGYVLPLNAGATVHAIQNTDTFTAIPDSKGYFMICGLDGTYDVWINPSNSALSDTLILGVNVPFGTITDMDTITLK